MDTRAVFLFLFWGVNLVLAQSEVRLVQFRLGGDLQLSPVNPPKPITSITWKHQGNIVAEWIQGAVDLEFLGILKDRSATVNLTTGELKVSAMEKKAEGLFTVEINNVVQGVSFNVREVKPVPEPEVVVRPLTCNDKADVCTLSCEAKSGAGDQIQTAEPVQYRWRLGDGEWELSVKDKDIKNDEETRQIKTFSCKMKNKISEKESSPLGNPFKKITPGLSGGAVAGIIIGVFLAVCAVLGGVGCKCREKLKPYLPCLPKNDRQHEMQHNGENKMSVTDPLNQGSDPSDKVQA